MKLQILFLFLFLNYTTYSQLERDNKGSPQKFIVPKDPVQNYLKLCTILVRMMENSNVASKGNLEVLIFSMVQDHLLYNFEGFHTMFNKVQSSIITTRSFTLSAVETDVNVDFVIILVFKHMGGYEDLIKSSFYRIFPDTSIRIFLVALDTDETEVLFPPFAALAESNYHNMYGILQHNLDVVEILRIKMKKQRETLYITTERSKGDKFKMITEILKKGDFSILKIVHYDMPPLTYVKNGIIYGADGNMIREFCKKYKLDYQILNNQNVQSLAQKSYQALQKGVDILLTTNIYIVSKRMIGIWLNEMDGGCLLVPRNIPISSIENLAMPFDSLSVAFMALSVALLIVFWKIIGIVYGKHVSAVNIVFDVYQLTFGIGISTLDRLSLKEKFMILCFMCGSFFLATTYQSIILSLMLMDPAMRSARDIKELNASNTKFYMFYDQNISHNGDPLFIRQELILNIRNFNENFDLPRDLDYNLVYFISCKYANIFLRTPRNFRDGKRLFDRIVMTRMLQQYSVKTEFYYKEEFALLVSALTEFGIYSFWEREFINSVSEEEKVKHEYEMMIEFHNMKIPFIILSSGYLIALHAFAIEKLIYLFMNRRLKLHRNISLGNPITRKRDFFKIRGKSNSNLISFGKGSKVKKKGKHKIKIMVVKPYVGT